MGSRVPTDNTHEQVARTVKPKSGSIFQVDVERMIRAARNLELPVESVGITADGMIVTLPEAPKPASVSPLDELAAWEHGQGKANGRP